MINAVLGTKKNQTQMFLTDGTRIPVTEIAVSDNFVIQHKTGARDGYFSVQLGINRMKNPTKANLGHSKKGAKLDFAPNFLKEVRLMGDITEESLPALWSKLDLTSIFEVGDVIDVLGKSKGKGFAGVVKRHHFRGGPRTHGQSDRERAPGSLGQTTTPGRVYKNKRMAGKMGFENVTVKNLLVVDVMPNTLLVKGLVPGPKGVNLYVEKIKKAKNFTPLLKTEEKKEEKVEVPTEKVETAASEEVK